MESLRRAKSESSPERQQQRRRLTLLATFVTAAGAIVLVAAMQYGAYLNTLANAQRRVNGAAASIVHLTDLQIESTQGPLQAVGEALRLEPGMPVAGILARVQARHPELSALVALDNEGAVLGSSSEAGKAAWTHVLAHPPTPLGSTFLRVGVAPSSPKGASLRVTMPSGAAAPAFLGAEISATTIVSNLRNSPFGSAGSFLLLHRDGSVVAQLGESTYAHEHAASLVRGLFARGANPTALMAADPDNRLYGLSTSDGFNYVVIASLSRRDALAVWSSQAWPSVVGMLILLGLIGVASALTLRAQRRQAILVGYLLTQAEHLDNVQRIGHVGLWELDLATGRLGWSDEALPFTGSRSAPASIAGYLSNVDARDRQAVSSWFWRCMHEEGPHECEHRIVQHDGESIHVHMRAVAQEGEHGRKIINGTIREVTALHAAQQQLRETEVQYRFLFDQSPLPAWVFDSQTHAILAVNEMALETYGYSRETFLRMRIEDLRPASEIPLLQRSLASKEALGRTDHIWLHKNSDGKLLHMRCDGAPIEFAGRPARLVVALDYTEKVMAERELATSNARFQMLARATNDAVWDMDLVEHGHWWSDAFYAIYGYSRDDDNGEGAWVSRIHEDDRERVRASTLAFLGSRELNWHGSYRMRRRDGSYADVFARAYVIRDDDGRAIRSVGSLTDQTAMVAARQALADSEESYHALLSQLPLPLLLVRDGYVTYANLLAESLFGNDDDMRLPAPAERFVGIELAHALAAGTIDGERIVTTLHPRGRAAIDAELSLSTYADEIGEGLQLIVRDITDQLRYEKQLNHQVMHDELTGLPNRRALHEALSVMVERAWSEARQMMLLFIDLDHFKVINDALGHLVGDEVLRKVSANLREAAGPGSYVARFGGDEFIAVVPCRDADGDVPSVLPALKAAIEQPLMVAGMRQHLSCSIGVAYLGVDGDDADTLIRNADTAMFDAKRMGRHTWRRYSPGLHDVALSRLAVVSRLTEEALEDELELHYQTQHAGADGSVFGVEALLRWPSGPGDLSMPNVLVPLLEETGTIVAVGRWVLRQACRDQARIAQIIGVDVCVSVNISAYQLIHGDLVGLVRTTLQESGMQARHLELELTETAFMHEPERAIETMRQLKAMGVSIALDDFGTGYSNLNYLSRMPIDKLKIDRSFVSRLPLDATDGALCDSILFLARSLSLTVIAEGVETDAQRRWLLEHGCSSMQGYLFARPQPLELLAGVASTA